MWNKISALLVSGLCLLLLPWGCSKQSDNWNVVIVTFDTTRADHFACYGNERVATPHLDQLAAEGVLFERAFAPIPITLPSHSSIMTGKVPFAHGVRDNGLFVLGPSQITLAEILAQEGYQTGAAIGSFPLTSQFGLDQGFEIYDDRLPAAYGDLTGWDELKKDRLFFDERKAARVNEALFPWLEKASKKPFFAWFHYFDPHHPHEPPPPYHQLYADNLYLGEIAYSDENLGAIINKLKQLGVYDKTLIVLTSDHGEGLGEHNESTHSLLCYNSTLHVPLIIKPPEGARGRRISQRVATVDVMPTILELLDVSPPAGIQGRSLAPLLKEGDDIPTLPVVSQYAETLSARISHGWGELRSLYDGDYKYIHGPRSELYNIANDHGELNDLIATEPEVAARLKVKLEQYLKEHAVPDLDASVAIDAATAERLMALGYIQSAGQKVGAIEEVLREDGTPPQDRAIDNSSFSIAKTLIYKKDFINANGYVEDLLRSDPENPHYLDLRLKIQLMLNRRQAALATIDKLIKLDKGFPAPRDLLMSKASIYLSQGQLPLAGQTIEQAQTIRKDASGQYLLAQLSGAEGNMEALTTALDKALELDPSFLPAQLDRATLYAQNGEIDAAKAGFERALADQPYHARAHYNYGVFLLQNDGPEAALPLFERAIKLNPGYLKAYQAVIDIVSAMGLQDLAHTYFQILQELAPKSQETQMAKQLLGLE